MTKGTLLYAQSGGVSAVINASACGVIQTALRSRHIGKVYAGRHGIIGALTEDLIDRALDASRVAHLLEALLAHDPANRELMTYPSPRDGRPINKSWLVPRTRELKIAARSACSPPRSNSNSRVFALR